MGRKRTWSSGDPWQGDKAKTRQIDILTAVCGGHGGTWSAIRMRRAIWSRDSIGCSAGRRRRSIANRDHQLGRRRGSRCGGAGHFKVGTQVHDVLSNGIEFLFHGGNGGLNGANEGFDLSLKSRVGILAQGGNGGKVGIKKAVKIGQSRVKLSLEGLVAHGGRGR